MAYARRSPRRKRDAVYAVPGCQIDAAIQILDDAFHVVGCQAGRRRVGRRLRFRRHWIDAGRTIAGGNPETAAAVDVQRLYPCAAAIRRWQYPELAVRVSQQRSRAEARSEEHTS